MRGWVTERKSRWDGRIGGVREDAGSKGGRKVRRPEGARSEVGGARCRGTSRTSFPLIPSPPVQRCARGDRDRGKKRVCGGPFAFAQGRPEHLAPPTSPLKSSLRG